MSTAQKTSIETVPREQWEAAAAEIEDLARNQRQLWKYSRLVSQLRRAMLGENLEQRAAQALNRLRY